MPIVALSGNRMRVVIAAASLAFLAMSGCLAEDEPDTRAVDPEVSDHAFQASFNVTGPAFVAFALQGSPGKQCNVTFDFAATLDENGPVYWIEYEMPSFRIVHTMTDKKALFFKAGNLVDSSDFVSSAPGSGEPLSLNVPVALDEDPIPFRAGFRSLESPPSHSFAVPLEVSVRCAGEVIVVDPVFSQTALLFDEQLAEGGVAFGIAESGVLASATTSGLLSFEVDGPRAQLEIIHTIGAGTVTVVEPEIQADLLPPAMSTTLEGPGGMWKLQFSQAGGVRDVFLGLLAGGKPCDCFHRMI